MVRLGQSVSTIHLSCQSIIIFIMLSYSNNHSIYECITVHCFGILMLLLSLCYCYRFVIVIVMLLLSLLPLVPYMNIINWSSSAIVLHKDMVLYWGIVTSTFLLYVLCIYEIHYTIFELLLLIRSLYTIQSIFLKWRFNHWTWGVHVLLSV